MTLPPRDINQEFPSIFSKDTVTSVKMMTGDGSTRKYLRVFTSSGNHLVLQVAEPFEGESPFLLARKIFDAAGVCVPKIVAFSGAKGWVLQEDLGEQDFQGKISEENFRLVLEPLVTLFGADLGSLKKQFPNAPHWGWNFDIEKLGFEMNFFKKHFVETLLQEPSSEVPFLERCCANLAAAPRILCHRDYHSRNMMNHESQCCVIDFQDARMGPASYDWVSILWDPYSPLPQALRDQGKDLFHQLHLTHLGVARQDSEVEYWTCLVQRMLKAVGSYASFLNLRGRTEYLKYIPPALENAGHALRHLQSLGALEADEASLLGKVDDWRRRTLAPSFPSAQRARVHGGGALS